MREEIFMALDQYQNFTVHRGTLTESQQLEDESAVMPKALASGTASAQCGDETLLTLKAMEQQTGKVLSACSQ